MVVSMRKIVMPEAFSPKKVIQATQVDTNKPSRSTYGISINAKQAVNMTVVREGYGLRGKSRWITDAINEFLSNETWGGLTQEKGGIWKRIVVDTETHKEPLTKDAINIDEEIRIKLWHASIEAALYGAELDEPIYLEISASSIIRAAIMWKLGSLNYK